MFIDFFFTLKRYGVSVSTRELLDLIRAIEQHVVFADIEQFYYLARLTMVKDESQFDKFDRAFAHYFDGVAAIDVMATEIPQSWLEKQIERTLSKEEKAKLQSLGGLDKLLETLKQRLAEQKARHQGGNKWVGTGGTSPFGAYGDHPEGVRIGQHGNRQFSAAKVWDKRTFRDLSNDVELGTRNLKVALRKLRKFARTGAAQELDITSTIERTARQGMLDIQMRRERHNAEKVLLFFDVGGSMDPYIKQTEAIFSAVQSEFKHMEYFYFHNCVYEAVWTDNQRRDSATIPVWDIIHKYGRDYKVIFVGDATMGPYEIDWPGGSVEHFNEEAGEVWIQRLTSHFNKVVWLNPQPQSYWAYYPSIGRIQALMGEKMFPLTLDGLNSAVSALT